MCNVQGCRKAPHQHHCLGDGMGASAGPESWQHEQVVTGCHRSHQTSRYRTPVKQESAAFLPKDSHQTKT